jgi:dTMP kinase
MQYRVSGLSSASLQLLHIAAHIDAIERRIKPTLGQGRIVILDRFWWSTMVYGAVSGVSEALLRGMRDVLGTALNPTGPAAAKV